MGRLPRIGAVTTNPMNSRAVTATAQFFQERFQMELVLLVGGVFITVFWMITARDLIRVLREIRDVLGRM